MGASTLWELIRRLAADARKCKKRIAALDQAVDTTSLTAGALLPISQDGVEWPDPNSEQDRYSVHATITYLCDVI